MAFGSPLGSTHDTGSPRFLHQSFGACRPDPPRQAQQLLTPVSSLLATGFTIVGKTGHLQVVANEA